MEKVKEIVGDLVAVAGGALSSGHQDWIRSASNIAQSAIKGSFFESFQKEWNEYKEKGKIKDDYLKTEQGRECFAELLDTLEKETADSQRLKAMKALFFSISQEKLSNRNDPLPLVYLKIIRKLSGQAILIMLSAYKVFKARKFKPDDNSAHNWLNQVAQESGYKYFVAIEPGEAELIDNKIIGGRAHGDRSGVHGADKFRFTDFGLAVCSFIEMYEEEKLTDSSEA